jgi:cytochrome c oxidase cbb3-type subunit 2
MPSYPWLARNKLDADETAVKMRTLRKLGVPYADEQIEQAASVVEGHTESDALIAYLQSLGLAAKQWR